MSLVACPTVIRTSRPVYSPLLLPSPVAISLWHSSFFCHWPSLQIFRPNVLFCGRCGRFCKALAERLGGKDFEDLRRGGVSWWGEVWVCLCLWQGWGWQVVKIRLINSLPLTFTSWCVRISFTFLHMHLSILCILYIYLVYLLFCYFYLDWDHRPMWL